MIDLFKLKQKNWKPNNKVFIIFIVGILVYVLTTTISFLAISLINRAEHWKEYAIEGNFNDEEFSQLVHNTSIITYIMSIASVLIFLMFLIFSYKKNGVGYVFVSLWFIIWSGALVEIWLNKFQFLAEQIILTLITVAMLAALAYVGFQIKKHRLVVYDHDDAHRVFSRGKYLPSFTEKKDKNLDLVLSESREKITDTKNQIREELGLV